MKIPQLICTALLSAASLQAASLTLVTHGMTSKAGSWLLDMGLAIRQYQAGLGYECDVFTVMLPLQTMVQRATSFEITQETFTSKNADRNIVVIFDWTAYAASSWVIFVEHDTGDVAPYLEDLLTKEDPLPGITEPLYYRTLHFIGHSRGGSLLGAVGDRLRGKAVIEHFTTLDPRAHPLSWDLEPHVPGNVMFADNYYQTYDTLTYGEKLDGADNHQPPLDDLYSIPLFGSPSRPYVSDGHTNIRLWYQRTIKNDWYVGGDPGLLSQWFTRAENGGRLTGYYYAYCPNGVRLWSGYRSRRHGRPEVEWSYNPLTKQRTTFSEGHATGKYYRQISNDLKTWRTESPPYFFDGQPFQFTETLDLASAPNTFYRWVSSAASF